MLFLLSPAKKLDFDNPVPESKHSLPVFVDEAKELIELMREKTPAQVSSLMRLSDKLAALNVARYQAWQVKHHSKNSKQAAFAFHGDVYEGLNAQTLSQKALDWMQKHLFILSGLYGVLRPLDFIEPYRLEMGVALENSRGKDLYAFWRDLVTNKLIGQLQQDKTPILVNLASQEYFKVVDTRRIPSPIVQCVFEEYKAGSFKVVSFYAKRARGLMMRFASEQQIDQIQGLLDFAQEGYHYNKAASTENRLVFRRKG